MLEDLQVSLQLPKQRGMARSTSAKAAAFVPVCSACSECRLSWLPNRKGKKHLPSHPCLISKSARQLLPGSFLQRTPLERPSSGGCSTCLSRQDRWTLAVALGKAAGCWHRPSALLPTGYRVQVFCGQLPAQALIN